MTLFDDQDILDTCEEYLYWASKQHDTPGQGTTFPAIREALRTEGQPLEDAWPYDAHRDDQDSGYTPPDAAHTALPRWKPAFAPVPSTPNSVRAELDAGRAVVLGLPTWPGFDVPIAGRLLVPTPSELDGAHHAVTVIGYDETTSEMLIRNSWGPRWGDDGAAWMPLRFLDDHVCATWVVSPPRPPGPSTTTSPTRYGSSETMG